MELLTHLFSGEYVFQKVDGYMSMVRKVNVVSRSQEAIQLIFRGVLGVDLLDGYSLRLRYLRQVLVAPWSFRDLALHLFIFVRHLKALQLIN